MDAFSTVQPIVAAQVRGYLTLADELLASATPQEVTLLGITKDERFVKALQGFALVARHELLSVMQMLRSWYISAANELPKSKPGVPDSIPVRAKRVVVESLLLEPSLFLIDELATLVHPPAPSTTPLSAPPSLQHALTGHSSLAVSHASLHTRQRTTCLDWQDVLLPEQIAFCNELRDRCFDWLIRLDELLPPPDLASFRQHMYGLASRVLGALSRVNLYTVMTPFLQKLKALVNPDKGSKASPDTLRVQISRLCGGMQLVTLGFATEEQCRASASFLEAVQPLKFNAAIKKSQVHHCLAEMVTKLLTPLVTSGQPLLNDSLSGTPQLQEWFAAVSTVKDKIWEWMQKHDKHYKVGWPLATTLVCLLDGDRYTAARDAAADYLLKQLKNKEHRMTAVRCLVQLTTSMMIRLKMMPKPELVKYLDKIVRNTSGPRDAPSLMNAAKKGALTPDEIKEMVSPWVELAPDYVILVIIELIQSDGADCVLGGLMACHYMLCTPPVAASALLHGHSALAANAPRRIGSALGIARFREGGHVFATPTTDVLELMRAGYHPLDFLGLQRLSAQLTAALAKLWQSLHTAYGTLTSPGMGVDTTPNARSTYIAQFKWLLRLSAFTRPEAWPGFRPLDYLPLYLNHPELRLAAFKSLEDIIRGCPQLRNAVLLGVAGHCTALPDDNPVALREGLTCLRQLTDLWTACVRARTAGEVEERSTPEASMVDLHRLEGGVWANGLCCFDERVRQESLQVLAALRTLHQALQASPAYQPAPPPALLAAHLSAMPPASSGHAHSSAATSSHANALGGPGSNISGAYDGPLGSALGGPMSAMGSADHGAPGGRSASAAGTPRAGASHPGSSMHAGPGSKLGPVGGNQSGGLPPAPRGPHHARHGSHTSLGSSLDGAPHGDLPGISGNWGGLIDMQEAQVTYMCDVLEQSGTDMVRVSYWDWGDLSNLNGTYKEPPLVLASLTELLTSPCVEGDLKLRLTRLMIELAKTMAVVSPLTSGACLHELSIGRLARMAVRSPEPGRLMLAQDPNDVNQRKADVWRFSGATALAIPTSLRDTLLSAMTPQGPIAVGAGGAGMTHSGSQASLSGYGVSGGGAGVPPRPHTGHGGAGRVSGSAALTASSAPGLSMRDVVRCHISVVAPGAAHPVMQTCSIMALGHAHPSHYDLVLEELSWLIDEFLGSKPSRSRATFITFMFNNESGEYVNRGSATAGRTRLEEGKRVQAHILRLLAQHAPIEVLTGTRAPGTGLSQGHGGSFLRRKLVDWLLTTLTSLRDARAGSDVLWDNVQVAYCFASVLQSAAGPLADALQQQMALSNPKDSARELTRDASAGPRTTPNAQMVPCRKAMYDALTTWTADAALPEREFRTAVRTGIKFAVDKVKFEPTEAQGKREEMERELGVWAEALDHIARSALAAVLQGPLWDADVRRTQGPVLLWIDRMLRYGSSQDTRLGSPTSSMSVSSLPGSAAPGFTGNTVHVKVLGVSGTVLGPARPDVGRTALLNLLQSNLELFPVYLDKSYDAHPVVAATYFQVLCEVYTHHEVPSPPHVLVSLILYKMVDSLTEVREDARHMLGVLAARAWGSHSIAALKPAAVPNGASGVFTAAAQAAGRERESLSTRTSGQGPLASSGAVGAPGNVLSLVRSRSSSGGHAAVARTATAVATAAGAAVAAAAASAQVATAAAVVSPGGGGGAASPHTPSTPLPPLPAANSPFVNSRSAHGGASERGEGDDLALDQGGVLSSTWMPPDGGAAFSSLLDTYQDNQRTMSDLLARTHPELSEKLCEEMMTRALECTDPSIQQPVLTSVTPWMNNLTIQPKWQGTWSERLLKSMYYVTQRHGASSPYEIQALWCTLASLKDNVRHMLLFLVDMGMAAGQQDMASLEAYLSVAKRICLFLARTHPQFTIDQLQTEIAKQVSEVDSSGGGASYRPPVEFEMLLGDSGVSAGGFPVGDPMLPGGTVGPDLLLGGLWQGDYSPQQSYDLKVGGPSSSADWRGGTRMTRSGEGVVLVPRLPSNTSSRSSNTMSQPDAGARTTAGKGPPLGSGSTRTDDLPRMPSSPRDTGGIGGDGSVAGGAQGGAPPGVFSDPGRGPRESGQLAASHPLTVPGSASAIVVSGVPLTVPHGSELPGTYSRTSTIPRSTGGGRSLISRPELSICLLSEVAYECDEQFTESLPLLVHACCCMLDAESPLVYTHAASLLTALVHSVGSWWQEQCSEAGNAVDLDALHQVISYVLSMRGRRLWAYEDTSCACPVLPSFAALRSLVQSVVRALPWFNGLQVQWAEHALDWALHASSRHTSGRSFQVFRSLQPPLDADLLTTLLLCLHTCLDTAASSHRAGAGSGGGARTSAAVRSSDPAGPRMGADCALEVLQTLQTLVEGIAPPSRLVLYPQVFWLALSLLHSSVVALYGAGLQLLSSYMRHLPVHQAKVLNVLLAAAPGLSGHILLHAGGGGMGSGKTLRGSELGGLDSEPEEPELWALGSALLQLPTHDTSQARHWPLAVQQLLLRGLLVAETLPATLHALADMAAVLEVQGAALQGQSALRDVSNGQSDQVGPGSGTLPLSSQSPNLSGVGGAFGVIPPGAAGTVGSAGAPGDSLRKHRLLRLDAHQALLGPSHTQLLITCLCTTLHALAVNNTSAASQPVKSAESTAAQAALARCLVCLSRACDAHGLTPLVAPLQQAAHVWAEGAGVPLAYPPNTTKTQLSRLLLRQLCAGIAACFFPRYGSLIIHHCMDSLATPSQSHAKTLAVLQLMHTLFTVATDDMPQPPQAPQPPQPSAPGLQRSGGARLSGGSTIFTPVGGADRLSLLGPSAVRLLTNPTMLAPLTEKQQGPLAGPACDALAAVVAYTAAWQHLHGPGALLGAGGVPDTPSSALSAQHSWSTGTVASAVARTLYPASVNTAAAVRRVIDTLGSSAWRGRRVTRLLPHLGTQHRDLE